MYKKPQALIDVAARLAELRFTVLDTVNASPYTTPEERATTALRVAACQNEQTLVKWYCNLLTLLSARELAPPVIWANAQQRDTIFSLLNHPKVTRQQKTSTMLVINRLTEQQASELIGKLYAQTGLTPPPAKQVPTATPTPTPTAPATPARQLTLPHLTTYAPKAERPRHRLPVVPSLGTAPQGIEPRPTFAAVCRLHRLPSAHTGGRWRVAQPGEAFHLCYHLN